MQSFKLDEFNNLIMFGNISTISDENAVKQDVKTLLRMFNTEYPFDTREGIPYYFLASRNNTQVIKSNVIERVMKDTRVKSVKRIDVNFIGGNMQISLDLILKSGVIINV